MNLSRKWLTLAGTVLALGAALPAATAFAKNGDDDPVGHVRHGGDDAERHLAALPARTAATASRKLIGTVGKDGSFKITLTDASGHRVRSLKAGTYTIVVHDDSALHNFELEREHGLERELTDVSAVGTKTVRLKLTRGSYEAYCDPHKSTMFQRFTVR
jgi:plastocyanin